MRIYALLAIAASLALAPPEADEVEATEVGGPEAGDEVAETTGSTPLEQAGAAFVSGQLAFDAKKYDEAIDAWTEALDLVPDEADYDATRTNIRMSIAAAYVERHAVGGDITDLRKADRTILEALEVLPENDPVLRAPVEAEHERVRAQLEIAERKHLERAAVDRAVENEGRRQAAREREAEQMARQREEQESGARIMIIAGGVTSAVGVGFVGAMTVSLVQGRAAEREGELAAKDPNVSEAELRRIAKAGDRANSNALTTGLIAAAALIPGTALLAVGLRNRKRAATITPVAGAGFGGVVIGGRF